MQQNGGRRFSGRLAHMTGSAGQATVEFAVVMVGFLAATVALGAIWHAVGSGLFVDQAIAVASHHVQSVALATVTDVFLY